MIYFRLNQEELDETTTILLERAYQHRDYATKNCWIFSLNQLDTLRGAGTRGVLQIHAKSSKVSLENQSAEKPIEIPHFLI